ncbi:MAG: hypothetical protein EBY21_14910, partial [Alphaproteobacteria bacterium]|nr:hypothetical protein [Alphaproteobacteria bacterium]
MTETLHTQGAIFLAGPLNASTIRQAFPLAKLFNPQLDLASWSAYARSLTSRPAQSAGLHMLQDQRGYVHALFAYRIGPDLVWRRLLRISDLVICLLPGMALIETLLASFSDLALNYGCDNIIVELGPASPARAALQAAGF